MILGVALAVFTVTSGVALVVCRSQSQAYLASQQAAYPPRVEALIADELRESLSVTEDWGNWDGLYNAILNNDRQFLRNNIGPKSLEDTECVFIGVYDVDGNMLRVDTSTEIDGKPIGHTLKDRQFPVAGLTSDPTNPSLIYRFTAVRVRQSDGSGEVVGTLAMIRPLEEGNLWNEIIGATTLNGREADKDVRSVVIPKIDVLSGRALDVSIYYRLAEDTPVSYRVVIATICVLWAVMLVLAGVLYRIVGIAYPRRISRVADKAMAIAEDIMGDEREITYGGRCPESAHLVAAINTLLARAREALAAKDEAIAAKQVVIDDNERRTADHLRVLDELASYQGQMAVQARIDAVATLAQGIAHNVNNALCVILGYIEVIMLEAESGRVELSSGMLDRLRMIAASSTTIEQTVAGLRKLYRETDRDLQFTPCDINGMIGEIVEMMRGSLQDGGVTRVSQDLDMSLPTTMALSGELRDAIVNLVRNAIEAMPDEGGTVEIATHLSQDETGQWVEIAVSDTGIGMSSDTLRLCVDYMFTTKELGSGVGLPTVAGTARRHKGRLEIESELGTGSTFRLIIPFRPAESQVPPDEVVSRNLATGLSILYVEDEAPIRTLVEDMLTTYGYTVTSAPDAEQGIRKLTDVSSRYDLVLTDLAMPGELDGRAVAREASARGIPVVIMTGYGHVASDVPHDGLVCKPFRAEKLVGTIDDVLQEKRSIT